MIIRLCTGSNCRGYQRFFPFHFVACPNCNTEYRFTCKNSKCAQQFHPGHPACPHCGEHRHPLFDQLVCHQCLIPRVKHYLTEYGSGRWVWICLCGQIPDPLPSKTFAQCKGCGQKYTFDYPWCPFCGHAEKPPRPVDLGGKTLEQIVGEYAEQGRYSTVGNLMLEILTQPHQEHRPDANALALESLVPPLVVRARGISDTLADSLVYDSPLRDRWIDRADWGDWAKDRYIRLLVFAFLFGPTLQNLPYPFKQLREGLRPVIQAECDAIRAAEYRIQHQQQKAAAAAAQRPATPGAAPTTPSASPAEIAELIRTMMAANLPPEFIAEQVATLVAGQRPKDTPSA